jgi:AcrR family transcriptional regulator
VERSQRARLIAALAQVSAEKGYATATVSDIVRTAHVSKRVLYEHFSSKADCFSAAVEAFGEASAERIAAAQSAPAGDWIDDLRQGLAGLLDAIAADPALAKLGFLDSIAARVGPREPYSAGGEQLRRLIERSLAAAPGGLDPAPGAQRSALGGALGLLTDQLIADQADRLPQMLPELMYIVLVPYLGQLEALNQADRAREELAG